MPNPCGKTRPKDDPYEVWEGFGQTQGWTWKVLKKQKSPEGEAKDPFARWFCLVTSPFTGSMGDMGDVYATEVQRLARRVS